MAIFLNENGQLTTLASACRTWIGTTAAHEAAIQAGTMPNNCTVAIIDEAQIDANPTDAITNGDMHPVTSNAVYDELYPATPSPPTPITTGVCGVVTWDSCTITRYGNLVQFTINNLRIPSGAAGAVGTTVIATGFPPAKLRTYVSCKNTNSGNAAFLTIANNDDVGQLLIDNGMNANNAVAYLSGMYIAMD